MKETAVISFGRMNPMTNGHEKLADKIKSEASKRKADAKLYLSHSTNPKKDPLDFATKVKFAKRAFGPMVQNSPARTIIEVAKELTGKYDNLVVVVGSDRIPEFKTLLNKYNGRDYNFKSIEIISAGERDPDAEGVEGMSGSKMRGFVSADDFDNFKKGVPSKLSDADAKALFAAVKKGMNLKEELENEDTQMDEALSMSARRQRAMQIKRLKSKILRARMLAMKRFASQGSLKKRARRKALSFLKRRFGGGKAYQDLSVGQKIAIDKKIEKMRGVVGKISARLLPQVRKAEIQRKQNMNKAKAGGVNENFLQLFEKPDLPQDKDVSKRDGTQPSKYYKGVDKDTKHDRASHFEKHAKKSDSDPSSYKDAPGDKEAREKGMPQSKHTLKFKQMFGEEIGKKEVSRLDQLVRLGLADKSMLATLKRAMSKIDGGETLSTQERSATQSLLSTLLDMVTNTDQLFNMTKAQLRKEDVQLVELAYPGNIGIMELAKFYQKASANQVAEFKKLLESKEYKKAWALIQDTLGVKLVGKQFESFIYEDEDENEYEDGEDVENDGLYMSSIEIQNIMDDAEEILYMLESMEEEPEAWVASKITLAADYLSTVRDYLEYNSDYSEDDDEDDEMDDDDAFIGDEDVYECILEMGLEEIDEEFREDFKDIFEEVDGLKKKAEKSGIPYGILKKVYDRGMAAWKGGHRPGTTPQQWAFARVNSFITKGKGTWGGADSDLAAKVGGSKDKNEDFSSFLESMEWGTDELRKKYAEDTPGQPTEIQVADKTLDTLFRVNVEKIERAHSVHESIVWHTDNKTPLSENVFRVGSEKYFELFREARKLYEEGKLDLSEDDKHFIVETDIGEIVEHEGKMVPLDCPMLEEEEEKDVEIGKPKRGGPKKFYVYVRKPDGGIKKVTWGDTTGLSVKMNDPEARKSFAARHQCSTQKDRTSAAYWACNTPRYAKQLGLSGGGNFYW